MLKRKKQLNVAPCRQCLIIRYFLLAAGIGILLIPIADTRFDVLSQLSAWHFVGFIWGIGLLGMLVKVILDRPSEQSKKEE